MKILDKGYWTSKHFYWQSMYFVLLNGIRFRSLTFFSACNPAIDLGGMLYDRKTDIYDLLPKHIVPATTIITTKSAADIFLKNNNLKLPVIIKPNVGLKGYKVSKIGSSDDLNVFFSENDVNEREWLLQEYLDYKKEYSALFYKYPLTKKYGISSFIEKSYPFVKGDGISNMRTLIENNKNPFIVRKEVEKRFSGMMDQVPEKGKHIILDFIGNYSRGAKFHSRMEFVSKEMESMLSALFQQADGLNFFRIDFKSDSVDSFLSGNFKVLEINGMKSEPLHIYDPVNGFMDNARIIRNHWKIIQEITEEQRELSVGLPSFKQGLKSLISIKKLVR